MANKILDALFSRKEDDQQVGLLKKEVDQLKARMEESSIEDELKAMEVKAFDESAAGAKPGDFSSIEEEISRSQLQKLMVTEGWFYICVTTIAKTISALPPKLEMKKKVQQQVFDSQGKPQDVVREAFVDASGEPEMDLFLYPNDIQTAVEFWMLVIMDLLATGDAFIYIDKGPGSMEVQRNPIERLQDLMNRSPELDVKGLYRLSSPMVEPIPSSDGKFLEGYGMQTSQGYFKFALDEIIHLKLPNPVNPYHGLSPIVAVLKNILVDRYTKEHFIRFYKQGARLGGVIQTEKQLTKEQISRLERTFEQNYTGRQNHHRTAVLPAGMKYEVIEQNPGETSLIEFMKFNKEPILAAFNVPPVKIGILDGASFANALIQYKVYYTDTIMPVLSILEQNINMNKNILTAQKRLKFTFDLSGVEALQDNLKEKADTAKTLLEAGMTPNEVRQKIFKMGPLTGGDKSPVIEKMKDPGGGMAAFFGRSAEKPTTEKTDPAAHQPDAASINPSKPTRATFEERVAELAAASINQGIPLEQALMMATVQTLAEGFTPTEGAYPTTPPNATTTPAVDPSAEKKTEDDLHKEEVIQSAAADTPKNRMPNMSKEQIAAYWKDVAGDSLNDLMEKRDGEVQKFFRELEKVFLKNIEKAMRLRGLPSTYVEKDGKVDDEELDQVAKKEAERVPASMVEAFKRGYRKSMSEFNFDIDDARTTEILKKESAKYITEVAKTTKEQIRKILTEGHAEKVSVGEMASRIRDKFKQISAGRAKTIVRTEVLTAVSMGQDEKVQDFKKQYPKESKGLLKKWISAQDDLVRDSHDQLNDLDPIPEGEAYPNGLMYPRDPDGELSERINCRCAQITFLPEDQEEIEDTINNPSPLPNEGNNWLGRGKPE